MAKILANGSIQFSDNSILYSDTPITGKEFMELQEILHKINPVLGRSAMVGFPFGGGGGTPGPQGPPGPPGPNIDIFAATRIVSQNPNEGTDLTIAAAIAALPAEGGLIFVKQGTYSISSTLMMPTDKDVIIVGCGQESTTIDIGSNAIPAITIPDGLTADRQYYFRDLSIVGDKTVGQEGIRISDSESYAQPYFQNVTFLDLETIINVTAGDVTFTRATYIYFQYVTAPPPAAMTTAKLVKSASAGGSFLFASVLQADTLIAYRNFSFSEPTDGWSVNGDVDIFMTNSALQTPSSQASNSGGLFLTNSTLFVNGLPIVRAAYHAWTLWGGVWGGTGSSIFSGQTFGQSITTKDRLRAISCNFRDTDVIFDDPDGCLDSCVSVGNSKVFVNKVRGRIDNCVFNGASDIAITVAAAATYAKIANSHFRLQTTAGIQTAAQRTTITGCTFEEAGATKTVSEVGAADKTLGVGNNGVSSGGGLSIVGASSKFVIGDYNIA